MIWGQDQKWITCKVQSHYQVQSEIDSHDLTTILYQSIWSLLTNQRLLTNICCFLFVDPWNCWDDQSTENQQRILFKLCQESSGVHQQLVDFTVQGPQGKYQNLF